MNRADLPSHGCGRLTPDPDTIPWTKECRATPGGENGAELNAVGAARFYGADTGECSRARFLWLAIAGGVRIAI
jgi:hypothetical protein